MVVYDASLAGGSGAFVLMQRRPSLRANTSGALMGVSWPVTDSTAGSNTDLNALTALSGGFLIATGEFNSGNNGSEEIKITVAGVDYYIAFDEDNDSIKNNSIVIPVALGESITAVFQHVQGSVITIDRTYNWKPLI